MDADAVKAAVSLCERNHIEITVANVAANVALRPGDYNALIMRGLRHDVRAALKRAGYITADVQTNVKVEAADASLSELEALLEIKERNLKRVTAQTKALRALVEFLRIKRDELGYEPYVHLFEEDARRIYAMQGLDLPSNWDRRV
jgi:ATP-dependent Clp protease ATP-binding subunit ClpA